MTGWGRGPRWAVALPAAALLAGAVGGCGSTVATLSFAAPPPTPPVPTTVAPLPDTQSVVLPEVAGVTTTTQPAIRPGAASIIGTVLGPAGPVAGATVQAERIVGDQAAATEVVTGADGSFSLSGVLGGVYRVRAWQVPALAMVVPQTVFVASTATTQLSLTLDSYSGVSVDTSMAPDLVAVGGLANLVVAVDSQVVGADGVVRPTPIAGQAVDVTAGGGWNALGADPATTGTNGVATLQLSCTQVGAPPLLVTVAGATPVTVTTPACVTAATTTTTAPTAPTTTTVPGTTGSTTTVPGGGSAGNGTTTTVPEPTGLGLLP